MLNNYISKKLLKSSIFIIFVFAFGMVSGFIFFNNDLVRKKVSKILINKERKNNLRSENYNYCLPSIRPSNKFIDNSSYFNWYDPEKEHLIKDQIILEKTRNQIKKTLISKKDYKLQIDFNLFGKNTNNLDKQYGKFNNLKEIDQLTFFNKYGVDNIALLFKPKNTTKKLLLYHQGNFGNYCSGKKAISFFVDKGYHVLAYQLPLNGTNPDIKNLEGEYIHSTSSLIRFNSYEKPYLTHYVTPIVLGIDYITDNYKFLSISMTGISDGGWSTVMVAATDNRINYSFPVAGTLPINLSAGREGVSSLAGNKQFFNQFPYLDLYLLGSTGLGRSQIQISFLRDRCCFSGDRSTLYSNYVQNLATKFDGNFEIKIFDSANHMIDLDTAEFIHESIINFDSELIGTTE